MAFLGNTYQSQATTPATDFFNGNGVTTSFTLSRPVQSVYMIEVVVNNVPQNPTSSYSISGNTINFTSAPSTGTNNVYVQYNPTVSQLIYPSQGTVGPTTFTYPNVLVWDANGNITVANNLTVTGKVKATVPFYENATTITANYTLPANTNAMTAGPITINDGITVTVTDGSTWTIV